MTTGDEERRKPETADQRKARLAAELRSNLAKRKAQARARAASGSDDDKAGTGARSEQDGTA